MNIIFCPRDGGEDQEGYVRDKLLALHKAHPSVKGAQVNLCAPAAMAGRPTCQIDLTAYGEPYRVSRSAETYREAAEQAIAELTGKIEKRASGPLAK